MKRQFRGPADQRGESAILYLFLAVILLLAWGALDAAKRARDGEKLLIELTKQPQDRSAGLDPAFYSIAEQALTREQVQAPVGAWKIEQEDDKQRVEQLLVLRRDMRFSILSRTTLQDKKGEVGRVSEAKGTYQVKGAVLDLKASEGSPAWNGPYIIERVDHQTLSLRHQAKDVITYMTVTAAEVPVLIARLQDDRSDADIASADAAARYVAKLQQSEEGTKE